MKSLRKKTTATLLTAIFMISIFAVVVPVSATTTWYVDVVNGMMDDCGGPAGQSPGMFAFNTIQCAIDCAISGDIINVAPGTYKENVLINKELTLLGEDRATTFIDGIDMTLADEPSYGNVGVYIDLGAQYSGPVAVTISGFTVQNYAMMSDSGPLHGGVGIASQATYQYSDVEISDVTVKNNGYIGLEIQNVVDSSFSNILADNNDVELTIDEGYGMWIHVWSHRNTFEDITAKNHEKGTGIYVMQSDNNKFTGTTLDLNKNGMLVYDSSGTEIHYSVIKWSNTLGVKALADVSVDATLNWWETTDETQILTKVSGEVYFSPILESPPFSTGSSSLTVHVPVEIETLIISVSGDVNFGDLLPGATVDKTVTVTNGGNLAVYVTASLIDENPEDFYTDNLKMDKSGTGYVSVVNWDTTLISAEADVVDLRLSIPDPCLPGTYDAVLVFWAEAA